MLHPTIQTLIARLGELTERGEIPWKRYGANAYRFETEGYLVEVSPEPRFRILDTGEREIERADADLLRAAREGDWAQRVSKLAGAAQRTTTGDAPKPKGGLDARPLPATQVAPAEPKIFGAIDSFAAHSKPVAAPPATTTTATKANPYSPWR